MKTARDSALHSPRRAKRSHSESTIASASRALLTIVSGDVVSKSSDEIFKAVELALPALNALQEMHPWLNVAIGPIRSTICAALRDTAEWYAAVLSLLVVDTASEFFICCKLSPSDECIPALKTDLGTDGDVIQNLLKVLHRVSVALEVGVFDGSGAMCSLHALSSEIVDVKAQLRTSLTPRCAATPIPGMHWSLSLVEALLQDPPAALWGASAELEVDGQCATVHCDFSEEIGCGGCARLMRGTMVVDSATVEVAIKIPLDVEFHAKFLIREVERWRPLKHANILPLYGTCQLRGHLALIMPYMHNGDVRGFLRRHPSADRRKLLAQIAEALDQIHNTDGIVHGDIKGANILISITGSALLGDFGLGTTVVAAKDITEPFIRYARTAQFSAPELFADAATYPDRPDRVRSKTTMSDVFAFGSLIYEFYAGVPPWDGFPSYTIAFKLGCGLIPDRPHGDTMGLPIPDDLWELCERCWRVSPMERPRIEQILRELRMHQTGR